MLYRTWKTRLDTTTKFMVVVISLFNFIIPWQHALSCMNNVVDFMIYHDGSNNVFQVCSFIKPWTVCSNMHEQACQQHCPSWPSQPCSSWPARPCSSWPAWTWLSWPACQQPCSSLATTSCAFLRVYFTYPIINIIHFFFLSFFFFKVFINVTISGFSSREPTATQ